MIDKLVFNLSLIEGVSAAVSLAAPVSQFFPSSKNSKSKARKKSVAASDPIHTLTPLLVCGFALLAHFGAITIGYFELLRVALPLASGSVLEMNGSDFLLAIALLVFLYDVLKISAFKRKQHGNKNITGIFVSLFAFVISAVLFWSSSYVGSMLFLLLLMLAFFDLILWLHAFHRHK